MGLYPEIRLLIVRLTLAAKPGDNGYLIGRSRTVRFPLGTPENVPVACGYVFHKLALFDVYTLIAQQNSCR